MRTNSKIYVAVHEGCLGRAIVRKLTEDGYSNILLSELDLTSQREVEAFFQKEKPEYVFLLSIKTGGILANSNFPADFIYQNLASELNIIHSAFKCGAKKLLFLASPCSYPKECPQPIKEEYLLTGKIEETNEPYAISKISGIELCQSYNKQYKTNFISAIPTNFYGPYDDFDEGGHVIASLIRKFHEAKKRKKGEVKIWGTGKPKREFVFVDDIADGCIFLMEKYQGLELINIAGEEEISIKESAELLKKIINFKGKIIYEINKPDGIPRRLLDSSRIFKLGWRPKIGLREGLELTYNWYKNNF